jgi:hypothetical protein
MRKGFLGGVHSRLTAAWPRCGCTDPDRCPHARRIERERDEQRHDDDARGNVLHDTLDAHARDGALLADPSPPSTAGGVPRENNRPLPLIRHKKKRDISHG